MTSDEPGARAPAPEPLRLVQRFVNTHDREAGADALATPAALGAWLKQAGLGGAVRPTPKDLARAIALREALRSLVLANNGGAIDAGAVRTFDEAAQRARLTVCYGESGSGELVPQATGVDAALGRLVAIVHAAAIAGTWRRLKACRRDVCQWAFYDHSKNRSGTWCAMAVCGNRVKSRRHAQRRRRR